MKAQDKTFLERVRPEVAAGGFSRDDGTLEFYLRVQSLLSPASTVLDLGAGRGEIADKLGDDFRSQMLRIRGKVAKFVGADVDSAVLRNPLLDEAVVIPSGGPLPFDSGSFDLIISDWVLEHVVDPVAFAAEVYRILKPGGWFCARTPNKWGFVALGARLVPPWIESKVLARLQPDRGEEDIFPKVYKMNTRRALEKWLSPELWHTYTYFSNPRPAYHGNSTFLFQALSFYQRVVPSSMGTVLLVFARRM